MTKTIDIPLDYVISLIIIYVLDYVFIFIELVTKILNIQILSIL